MFRLRSFSLLLYDDSTYNYDLHNTIPDDQIPIELHSPFLYLIVHHRGVDNHTALIAFDNTIHCDLLGTSDSELEIGTPPLCHFFCVRLSLSAVMPPFSMYHDQAAET